MATVAVATNNIPINGADGKAKVFSWTPLTSANAIGSAASFPNASHVSVQFAGTFGTATVILEGSNDGINWTTLKDSANAAISGTAALLVNVATKALFYRANSSGGDGTTSVTVTLLATAA